MASARSPRFGTRASVAVSQACKTFSNGPGLTLAGAFVGRDIR